MTTPERLRRRQYREGLVLLLLAIFTVAQAIYFNVQDARQGRCIADKVNEITAVQSARATLVDRDSELIRQEAAATSHVILAVGRIHSSEQFQAIEMRYQEQVERIAAARDQVAKERAENPVPDFPEGSCGSSDTPAAAAAHGLHTLLSELVS